MAIPSSVTLVVGLAVLGFTACNAEKAAETQSPLERLAFQIADDTPTVQAKVDVGLSGDARTVSPLNPDTCPKNMVLVDGDYCTEVQQDCIEWMDPRSNPFARCAKYAPSVCTGDRVHMRFCIDRDEYTAPGQTLPRADINWLDAQKTCARSKKRLCRETEWEFACEGEEMAPYSVGFERGDTLCNEDHHAWLDVDGGLRDERKPTAELDQCISPFGVRNMIGNVDEWVSRNRSPGIYRGALKGGWWMFGRNRCRPATTIHGEHYWGIQVGFRCCSQPDSP